jgi:hypothetical protein
MYNTSGRNTSNGDPLTRDSPAATDLPQRCPADANFHTWFHTHHLVIRCRRWTQPRRSGRAGSSGTGPRGDPQAGVLPVPRSQERGSGPGWSPLRPGPYPHGVGPPLNREPPDLGRHRTVLVSAPGCDHNALLLTSLPLNLADRGCLVRRLASADRAPSPSDRRSSSSRMGRTFVVPDTRPRPCVGCLGVSLRAADL